MWKVGESLEQLFLTDYSNPDEYVAKDYISASKMSTNTYDALTQFLKNNSRIFIKEVVAV